MAKKKHVKKSNSGASSHQSHHHSHGQSGSHNKSKDKENELSLNFSLTKDQWKTIGIVALVLIPIFFAAFFRAYPATLPITDQWAEQSVRQFYQNQITQQITSQFQNLPPQQLQQEVNRQIGMLFEQNSDQIQAQIDATSEQFKQQLKNDNGETYLLAIDPWVYYMTAQSVLEYGHAGTELRDGKPYETRNTAPIGSPIEDNWHSWVMIYVWKILSIFDRGMSLLGGAFWVPLIVAALSTIPAFFIAQKKAGYLGGFIAAMIVAINGAFLSRTPAGFSDTDAYNVFFPLLVTWLFLEAFEAKELWKKIAFSSLSGAFLGIYSKIWSGYWYIFNILIVVMVGYLVFSLAKYFYLHYYSTKKEGKEYSLNLGPTALILGIFVFITGVVVSLLNSFGYFISLPLQFIGFSQLKVAVNPTLWPNVLTTVAELNQTNFAGVVGSVGGKFLFWLGLMGVVMALVPYKERLKGKDLGFIVLGLIITAFMLSNTILNWSPIVYLMLLCVPLLLGLILLLGDTRNIDIKYALMLLVWVLGTMYATTKGIRFTLVLVPPLGIAIGTFAGVIHKHLTDLFANELEIPKKIGVPILAILLCLVILVTPIKTAHAIALGEVPSMNDGWYESLTGIRDNSAPDAIITSWWDFGHWFKAIANRPVTFDGGTQNTPMAHWVGKLLLTVDEEESVGILRMLDCGSSKGYDTLNNYIENRVYAKKVMDDLVTLDRQGAQERLQQEGLDANAINEVLGLTHCEPPEAFLITSQDMVSKSGVWGHFGSWSFEKAYIYRELRSLPEDEAVPLIMELGLSESDARSLHTQARSITSEQEANTWISGWPGYISGWVACNTQTVGVNTSLEGTNTTPDGDIENRTVSVCPSNLRVGSQQGSDLVIDAVIVDPENPARSRFRYGLYSNGVRVGESDELGPQVLYMAYADAADGIKRFDSESTSQVGAIFDEANNRIMLMDPLHAGSTFTQLFFLDGKYNDRYEKFSDRVTFNGQRIIVWKVKW